MTKEDHLKKIVDLKKQVEKAQKNTFNAFEDFWPKNDYENIKKLCDYFVSLTEASNGIQDKIIKIVKQCDNDYERAAPYICDMLLREWNSLVMMGNRQFGDLLNDLTEKQKGGYRSKLEELRLIDNKINRLLLSEYVSDD